MQRVNSSREKIQPKVESSLRDLEIKCNFKWCLYMLLNWNLALCKFSVMGSAKAVAAPVVR